MKTLNNYLTLLTILGFQGLLILIILSGIHEVDYIDYNNFFGFLDSYDLTIFFTLFAAITIIGLFGLFFSIMNKKKSLCPILAATVVFSLTSNVNAFFNTDTLINSETDCPDYDHIHMEDFIASPVTCYTAYGCEIHCSKDSKLGKLVGSTLYIKVGSKSRTCSHGNETQEDICYQYQERAGYACSLCDYTYTSSKDSYWGNWICK